MGEREVSGASAVELVVDYTTLRAVAECSTKAAMTAVLALQPTATRLPLEAGIGAHACLAVWLEGGTIPEALSVFRDYYTPLYQAAVQAGTASATDIERLDPTALRTILRFWMTQWSDGGFPYTLEAPNHTELAVQRDLGDGVVYVALIDAVLLSKHGGRWFLDWKTTGRLGPWWAASQENSGQYTGQRWAGSVTLGEVEGVVVGGIGFGRLNTSTKRCSTHGVPYKECALQHLEAQLKTVTTTDAEIAAYARTVEKLVRKYQRIIRQVEKVEDVASQPMEGRLNGACGICDYREWCRVGRPASARVVGKLFQERRWNPLVEAEARKQRSGVGA